MTTKNIGIPTNLDFEHATDGTLEQDILTAGEQVQNRYIVKYPNMYIRTYTGHTYRLPLDLTAQYFDGQDDTLTPLDQIKHLLEKENLGTKTMMQAIEAEPSVVLLALASKYADVVENVQLASLGKYEPSGSK